MIYENVTKIDEAKRKGLFEAIGWLDGFLNGQKYVAGGDSVSIADFFLLATVAQIMVSNLLPSIVSIGGAEMSKKPPEKC